jgi:hypothetical protein
MEMRLTLKAVNEDLAKRGLRARLEKGDAYFYFSGGDATDWLDRTVNVAALSSLTLDQWAGEIERLKKLNREVLSGRAVKDRTLQKQSPSQRQLKRQ